MDWLDLFAVQGTLKSLLQHHSTKPSILQCSAFFTVQLSHPYMTIGKTTALTIVQSLSSLQLFATPRTAARQASLSITNSWSMLKIMSIESVMPSNHLILCCPLLILHSIFHSIMVISSQSIFLIRRQYLNFSISISFSNEYSGLMAFRIDWLVSLESKGLSRVFSNTTFQKHTFFSVQLSLWSNSHMHT